MPEINMCFNCKDAEMNTQGWRWMTRLMLLGLLVTLGGCSSRGTSLLPVVSSMGLQGDTWDDLDLYLINPNTGESQRLTDTPNVMETDPHLNKRGRRIVYVARAVTDGQPVIEYKRDGIPDSSNNWTLLGHYPSSLRVIEPSGTNPQVIYQGDGLIFSPTWSVKGDRIAFTEVVEGRMHVRVINADGTGLQDLGFGSSPSWRKDDAGLFYSDMDGLDETSGTLCYRVLDTGIIEELGIRGMGYTNFQSGLLIGYYSAAYSRRNEAVWVLTATNRQLRLTDPTATEHDLDPVFWGTSGMLVFSRRTDQDGEGLGVQLMMISRDTDDRIATPIDSPGVVTYTRGGWDVAQHYPR